MKIYGVRRTITALFLLILSIATQAQDGPVRLGAHISLEKNLITLHEPVLADITFDNPTQHGVVVNLGKDDEKISVNVVDPEGAQSKRPVPVRSGWSSPDIFSVAPNSKSLGTLVLSNWFNFERTGVYRIELTLSSASSPKEPFLYSISNNSAVLDLRVLPRDERSLELVCADLLARTKALNSSASAVAAAKALSKINDPIAVPFLASALKSNEFKGMMIDALARLKTAKALEALASASLSSDPETKMLARSALDSLRADASRK